MEALLFLVAFALLGYFGFRLMGRLDLFLASDRIHPYWDEEAEKGGGDPEVPAQAVQPQKCYIFTTVRNYY